MKEYIVKENRLYNTSEGWFLSSLKKDNLLIRCKDCKYWQDNNDNYPHADCRWRCDETPDADDFCSMAERKEE